MKSNSKRVLYLCSDRGISIGGTKGASIHIREFVEALKSAGHDVTVAVSKKETEASYTPDYTVHLLPDTPLSPLADAAGKNVSEIQSFRELRDYFRNGAIQRFLSEIYDETPFDLIYERYSLFGAAGRMFSHSINVPFVLEVNAPLVYEAGEYRKLHRVDLAKSIESFLFSNADHIVSVSEDLREYILNVAPKAKVSVVPNGVSFERFNKGTSSNSWREKLSNYPDDDFIVGFIGSVKPWHGVDLLLDTISELLETDSRFSLCVVGNGDKHFQKKLEEQCRDLKLKDKVNFLGAVPYESIPDIMKSMDALVAPYPNVENFYFSPLKIFEYMAAGRPIVASAIGQIKDVLAHEKTALLVPPGDRRALGDALRQLKSDKSLRERLAKCTVAEAQGKHSWQQRIENITKIFDSFELEGRYQGRVGHADTI